MGPGGFFPTNPDLADILGDTDLDFENFIFFVFFGSHISGWGPAWAQLGPGLGLHGWAQMLGLHGRCAQNIEKLQSVRLSNYLLA